MVNHWNSDNSSSLQTFLLLGCLVLVLSLTTAGCQERRQVLTPEDITANNRGVGLMGRFEYEKARQIFAQLAQRRPDWLDVQVNLAIAVLNRQQAGDTETALAILAEVLTNDPQHLRAHYCSGLLRFHLGDTDEALEHFRIVTEVDPADAYAAYFMAQGLMQQGRLKEAIRWYERAIAVDPYLRSAYYGAFQAWQRLSQPDEARAHLDMFQRLQDNPQARLAELAYTRIGPKATALAVDLPGVAPPPPPQGPLFIESQPLASGPVNVRWAAANRRSNLTACDMNEDSRLDLFVASALDQSMGAYNAVLLAGETGFTLAPDHPLAAVPEVNAAAWGDFDNDGLTDVYLCRQGLNQLWQQKERGDWEEVTNATQTAGGNFDTRDCVFFDADHDGDLDLFLVNADGPSVLLNNNLDGTFRILGTEQGLAFGRDRSARAVVPADLDSDRDVDIIVLYAEPPHQVYWNDRLWQYRPASGFEEFVAAELTAAVAGDVDANGRAELYTLSPAGMLQRWQPSEMGSWQVQDLIAVADFRDASPSSAAQLALIDVTGSGVPEVLISTPDAWAAYHLVDTGAVLLFQATSGGQEQCPLWIPVVLDPATGPAIVGLCERGPTIWAPGPGRYQFATLTFSGLYETQHTMRSNASGIGTRVAARVDSRWTVVDTFRSHAGPGQSLQPVSIGTGGAERIDFVTVDWSDGVFQSEIDLAAGTLHHITEAQRQLSSCPVLFAWDGRRFAFVSDILGVGGLGYAIGPGEYAPVRPWENFLLPRELLRPKDGRYQLKLTQPMEEVCYLDAARLVAYDLPPAWVMVLDERMGVAGPGPSGEPYFFQHEMVPVQAHNDRGEDITDRVITADRRATPPGVLDRRFIGRLRDEHSVVLTFPHPIDTAEGRPLLVIDGWIEYPYSQTMFAAWQAGAAYRAPTLEARRAEGGWVVVYEQFGYPAGMPRRMALPLDRLPAGTRELRIRTNQEIYWDRMAIAYAKPCPQAKQTVLALNAAELTQIGFPHRMTGAQRVPVYDYARRRPFDDTRHLAGWYTTFGPVTELLRARDDALVVFGPGEEIHMEFTGLSEPLLPGWTRHFVLEAFGWAKDMDLYTQDGETVGPLPTTGKPSEPRDQLHSRYNTRYEVGR